MTRANRRLSRAARYQRYADGPDPLAPPADLSEALEAVGRDVMAGSSVEKALREFLRQGGRDRTGLDDLARRVAERRRDLTRDHHLDGTLQQVRQLLDQAVRAERAQLARDVDLDDSDRAFAQLQLDSLPPSPAGAVADLNDYRWQSADARQAYEQIKDLLGRELLDQRFAGMKDALENASDADRAAVAEMLRDLDELLDAHARDDDTPEQFDDFMAKHGSSFPEQPADIDELIDALAARAAAARRLRNSMTPEQRAELDALAERAFGSPELMQGLERLDGTLRSLRPGQDWSGAETMDGEQGLGLGDGTGVFQDLAELDALAEQLAQPTASSTLDDIDVEALGRQLGDQAAIDARTLRRLEKALRDSGTLGRRADGALALTPQAMRHLGKALLRDVAESLSGRQGRRDLRSAGPGGDDSGASREWAFGDTEPWDVTRTVTNAITRTLAEGGTTTAGVRLEIGDVEVRETDARTRACVALLVDTSFSMAMEDRWVPMKQTALALHTLITTRFRGDDLQLIGFGRQAEVMTVDHLVGLEAEWDKGTNLHHALLLANRHFGRHPDAQPVLLIVTDGEPTAHLEAGGEVFFDYPPHPVTVLRAVEQLDVARRRGAHTSFFRLGDDPGLARFVDAMARRVDGTVVAADTDGLGAAVVGSYVRTRATEPPA